MNPVSHLAPSTLALGTVASGTVAPGTPAPGTPMPWHVVTGEYPPARGGVSDYTFAVANALANAGDDVHVWCPAVDDAGEGAALKGCATWSAVKVHSIAGSWSAGDLRRIDAALDLTPHPRRLLVQWVPHAYGRRSINLRFCRWVRGRARGGDVVDLMVHEPGLGFGEGSVAHNAAAAVHRVMLSLLLSHARRVWIAIPAWADTLRRCAVGRSDLEFRWLPIPSTIPVIRSTETVAQLKAQTLTRRDGLIIGHFSTYPPNVRDALRDMLPGLLAQFPEAQVLLLGAGSEVAAQELRATTAVATRIKASGQVGAESLSSHLQICDVMLQPYSDGASTRRTTLMAALAHGIPVVTTLGRLSEDFWRSSDAVSVTRAGDTMAMSRAVADVLRDPAGRQRMSAAARTIYEQRFSLSHVVDTLRRDACEVCA